MTGWDSIRGEGMRFLSPVLVGALLFVLAVPGHAQQQIAVILPDARPPYQAVFEQILGGIEAAHAGSVLPFLLDERGALDKDFGDWLVKQSAPAPVLCLGIAALEAALPYGDRLQLVVGGVLDLPDGLRQAVTGIRLVPAPSRTLDALRRLAPQVKRVHMVISSAFDRDQLQQAERASEGLGLELRAVEVPDIKGAALAYGGLVQTLGQTDAIWIVADKNAWDEGSFFPLLLQGSWDKNLVVFSTQLAHVGRGVLFALYPDNFAMGRRLAELVMNLDRGRDAPGSAKMLLLTDVNLAVNIRTARHLRLPITPRIVADFDLVFPQK